MSTTPMTATHYVSNTSLYSAKAWGAIALVVMIFAALPALNLVFPVGHPLHVSAFAITLIGKFICYAMAALAESAHAARGLRGSESIRAAQRPRALNLRRVVP